MKSKKRLTLNIVALVALLAGNLILLLTIWIASKYDTVSLPQFLYQMKTPVTGANRSLVNSAAVRVGVFGIVLTLIEVLFFLICCGCFHNRLEKFKIYLSFIKTKFCRFIVKRALPIALCVFVLSSACFIIELDVIHYVNAITTESTFIEEHYVNPNDVTLTFPEQKRNVVFIFLESLETTFADPQAGGPIEQNYMPELTALAEQNICFSHDDDLGGARSFVGTTWTAAAMVSQTSGAVVQVPLTADSYGTDGNAFIPGLVSIGEILEKEGYNQSLLVGSDAEFASRDAYFAQHGNYDILDINTYKERGVLPEDYKVWWGFEDEKLFDYAKEELTRLASLNKPFNFTTITCDTHFPNGYVCDLCDDEYEMQYPNVVRCSSKQVTEFVEWIKAQPFYENTTIILSGDHLTMDPDFMNGVDDAYIRTTYNCIINAASTPKKEKNRVFGTFDFFPTTLAAMGVTIEGERLGLGTNLFSDKQTLAEEYGYEELNDILLMKSEFYNDELLGMDEETTTTTTNE